MYIKCDKNYLKYTYTVGLLMYKIVIMYKNKGHSVFDESNQSLPVSEWIEMTFWLNMISQENQEKLAIGTFQLQVSLGFQKNKS